MRVIADLHIHGMYSVATSKSMEIPEIARCARVKGLSLVGTGDFTHPKWLQHLRSTLREVEEMGLYVYEPLPSVYFMLTTEVETVFEHEGRVRRVHHVVLAPSFEVVEQINERLSRFGSLSKDGRPTLSMPASELVEELVQVSSDVEVFPAHVFTPWRSVLGAFGGFDSIEEGYQDMSHKIHAIETGLSADPPMIWRLSRLDRFTLLSNSDSHSPQPHRIGREANVFELRKLCYREIIEAIRARDNSRLKMTIEVYPDYGKYHFDGHRSCKLPSGEPVVLSPREAMELGERCPVCGKKLTKGVMHRVEELADRPQGRRPEGSIPYVHMLPLAEVVAAATGSSPSSKAVSEMCQRLISSFGSEFAVLLDAPVEEISRVSGSRVAEAVRRVRSGEVVVTPGFDGVYGKIVIFEEGG